MPYEPVDMSSSQNDAIDHDSGHLRIIACPGSGKTETVSRRVARLIKKGVKPSSIVAFTFTVKAANELKTRIRGILEAECSEKSDFGDMYIGTIDAFCLYMLKKIKPEYRNFEVLDDARRTAFVDRWYLHIGINDIEEEGKWKTIPKFCTSFDRLMTERVELSGRLNPKFAECCRRYTEKLREERFFDFVSIIRTFLDMIRGDAEMLGRVNDEIKHVVFDEYQDVNRLQEEMLECLSEGSGSVCVVGDDDQNIFQWRGSNIDHILEFPDKYRKYGVTTITLDVNYRATDALIKMAARFITNNSSRTDKDMQVHRGQHNRFEHGDIFHRHFGTDEEEFGFICDTVQKLLGTGFAGKSGARRPLSYRDMAVIVRTNEDAARVMKVMGERGIPFAADSGTSVFKRQVVSLAVNSILYAFGHEGYRMGEIPDLDVLVKDYSEAVPGGDSGRFRKDLEETKKIAERITEQGWLPDLGLQEFYHRILSAMGAERGAFVEEDWYGLAVLSKAIADYEYVHRYMSAAQVGGLKWFIEKFAENSYSDPLHDSRGSIDAVRVLTIWKAKGLEFPVVFVPSFDDRQKPPLRSYFVNPDLYPIKRYEGGEEDDRRAFYTAVTRSQKYLFLTGAEKLNIGITNPPPRSTRGSHAFLTEMKNGEFSADRDIERSRFEGSAQEEQNGMVPSTYSELSIYERCPHDYLLRHVMGFNKGVPAAFGYGANIHNILNRIHTEYIRNKKVPDDAEISGIFEDMFYLRFASRKQADLMRQSGIRTVKKYVGLYGRDFERIADTEKRFEFLLEDALISGSIDLLKRLDGNGNIEIIDFKTSRSGDDYEYEINHAKQVRFYTYAAMASLGYKPDRATVHHLDMQREEEVGIGESEMEAVKNGIIEKVSLISAREFKPEPEESKCQKCDFRALCEHKKFEVGVNFKPVRSERRKNDASEPSDGQVAANLGPSRTSTAMIKKAHELANSTRSNGDGSYSVLSMSDPGKEYTVTDAGCECRGFREYPERHPGTIPTCSHMEAVRIFREKTGA